MKAASIDRVDMNSICPALLKQWAECYCEIWKEAPWNEDFWQAESVTADFRREMRASHAAAFLAMIDNSVVGFTHGYSVTMEELQTIAGNSLLDPLFSGRERVFYVDELGVANQHRGNRISVSLTSELIHSAEASGMTVFVLRTEIKALAARHVYKKLGFMELDIRDAVHPGRTYWFLDMDKRRFMDLFRFDQTKNLLVGVEREAFITNCSGSIVPQSALVLARAGTVEEGHWVQSLGWRPDTRFGFELSACQIESRTGPCDIAVLGDELLAVQRDLDEYVRLASLDHDSSGRPVNHNLSLSHAEVAPEDMPLDVYPDPTGRYQEIIKTMPRHVLVAACRVIGTHIHIGMPDHETALKVYNHVIKKCGLLCSCGNGSFGERLDIYRIVAPDCDPLAYKDWTEFYRVACEKGFDKDPRKCWTLIRISKNGTIEFRMFGTTPNIERIVSWAKICHDLCAEAMA